MYELKPCPRCGWAPRFETRPIVNNSYTEDGRRMECLIRIHCINCHRGEEEKWGRLRYRLDEAGDMTVIRDDRPILADAWNRRIEDVSVI